jgi:hypothetical protein
VNCPAPGAFMNCSCGKSPLWIPCVGFLQFLQLDRFFNDRKMILLNFYLPHMEYEGSIGLVSRKMKIFFADFHFLGLLMNKYMIWAIKKIPSVTRRCRHRRRSHKFVSHLQLPPYELESWNSGSRCHLGQLDVPHTQNFEIQVPKGSHLREVFEVLLFKP